MPVEKLSQEGIDLNASCADGRDHVNDLDQPSTYDGNIPMPIPVPTLAIMLKSASFCHGHGENGLYLNHEVIVQITPRVHRMNPGDMADCYDLFDPWILEITPSLSHNRVLFPIVSDLVAQGKLPLEFVGINSEWQELYRRI